MRICLTKMLQTLLLINKYYVLQLLNGKNSITFGMHLNSFLFNIHNINCIEKHFLSGNMLHWMF